MNPDAAATYTANFDVDVLVGRIEDVETFPKADLVVGGPPCQGFSLLNRAGVGLERRALWREYLRALDASGADVFLMENVPELLSSAEFEMLQTAARGRGFTVEAKVLNMADFGVPQRRRRAFVLGSRRGLISWPKPTHSDPAHPVLGTRPWATFRDAVDGLAVQPDGANWHRPRRPHAESVTRYQAVPPDGGTRFDMQRALDASGQGHLVPRCWRNKPTGTTDVFGRLWWDRPSLTIRTEFYKPEKGRYLHPEADRPITLREGARLMSFPDAFVFPEHQSMTSVGRQIGNAVPPRMAELLADAIGDHLDAVSATPLVA